ncbi:hypothetical protein SAMN04490182_5386 [Pseudomonas cedrina]|uniref:PIN domain-containing protein n=1 Tax=Pseudomonas cedrina TaxID=651740 RepID=A0ABY0V255_PSECE|nr:hypothetical protein SAMN04490182_5386 [Pseudomonas cedrina]
MSLIYISDTNIWIDFRNAGLLEQDVQIAFHPLLYRFCSL